MEKKLLFIEAEKIGKQIEEKGLKQKFIAGQMGISPVTLSNYLNKVPQNVTASLTARLKQYLQTV